MVVFRLLLLPLAVLYDAVTRVRNHLYNIGHKKSLRFQTNVIAVGNLSVGGTGKTPMIEYLLRLLGPGRELATLSRGYGRVTKGFRIASAQDGPSKLGDEPFQLFRKFGTNVHVCVGEERALAIPELLHTFPGTDVILLDDAFQHRSVDPQFSILLTSFDQAFYHDFVLPAGRLRESRVGASRADAIVVTKCPDLLSDEQRSDMTLSIQRYAPGKPVFFSGLKYDLPVSFRPDTAWTKSVILVSGIANPAPFEIYARSNFSVVHHFKFSDHYAYTPRALKEVVAFWKAQPVRPSILTTEKDMVKVIGLEVAEVKNLPWFYIPVRIDFQKSGADFDKLVVRSIQNSHQNT